MLLKKLDLDSNRLSGVPALPPSVEVLKMNNNELSTLSPHCLSGKAPFLWNVVAEQHSVIY